MTDDLPLALRRKNKKRKRREPLNSKTTVTKYQVTINVKPNRGVVKVCARHNNFYTIINDDTMAMTVTVSFDGLIDREFHRQSGGK